MKNCTPLEHVWKLRCRKGVRGCGAKHVSKSKHTKGSVFRALFKKCMRLWRSASRSQNAKSISVRHHVRTAFGRAGVVFRGRGNGFCTSSKVSQTSGFCRTSRNDGSRGSFDEDLQRWISRGRRSTRDISIRHVRRSGR